MSKIREMGWMDEENTRLDNLYMVSRSETQI